MQCSQQTRGKVRSGRQSQQPFPSEGGGGLPRSHGRLPGLHCSCLPVVWQGACSRSAQLSLLMPRNEAVREQIPGHPRDPNTAGRSEHCLSAALGLTTLGSSLISGIKSGRTQNLGGMGGLQADGMLPCCPVPHCYPYWHAFLESLGITMVGDNRPASPSGAQ